MLLPESTLIQQVMPLPATNILGYAAWVLLLFFCVKWAIQGFKGTHNPPPEKLVKIKPWLVGRTVLAWFLLVLFLSMAANSGRHGNQNPVLQDSKAEFLNGFGLLTGTLILLAGMGLSAWWIRRLNREWRQRRRNNDETKAIDRTALESGPRPQRRMNVSLTMIAGMLLGISMMAYGTYYVCVIQPLKQAQSKWEREHFNGWRLVQQSRRTAVQQNFDTEHGIFFDKVDRAECTTEGFPGYPACPAQQHFVDGKPQTSQYGFRIGPPK